MKATGGTGQMNHTEEALAQMKELQADMGEMKVTRRGLWSSLMFPPRNLNELDGGRKQIFECKSKLYHHVRNTMGTIVIE
jgi:hypothetical protein